jgi:hypothetical protein
MAYKSNSLIVYEWKQTRQCNLALRITTILELRGTNTTRLGDLRSSTDRQARLSLTWSAICLAVQSKQVNVARNCKIDRMTHCLQAIWLGQPMRLKKREKNLLSWD